MIIDLIDEQVDEIVRCQLIEWYHLSSNDVRRLTKSKKKLKAFEKEDLDHNRKSMKALRIVIENCSTIEQMDAFNAAFPKKVKS